MTFPTTELAFGTIYQGHVLKVLKSLPSESVHCCVTSPPYYKLRDYQADGQIGHEDTPELFVEHLVKVFRQVKRVLRNDGTFWLNIGDTYYNPAKHPKGYGESHGLKTKDIIGIPWMLAFALRADGWYLRQDVVWHKPDPIPEPCRNRCTKAHEFVFLLSKQPDYYFDHVAIQERATERNPGNKKHKYKDSDTKATGLLNFRDGVEKSNKRSVWTIGKVSFKGKHFACFPPKLPQLCIQAGTSEEGVCSSCGAPKIRRIEKVRKSTRETYHGKLNGSAKVEGFRDQGRHVTSTKTVGWKASCNCGLAFVPATVLDPFFGAGTTGMVAQRLRRNFIGIDINPEYIAMAAKRIRRDFKPSLWDFV